MRFASSATGAAQQSFVARRQLEPAHHQQRNAHWSARNRSDTWLRKRNLAAAAAAAAAAQVAPGARKLEPEKQQQEPSNFVARAERGPQGPKVSECAAEFFSNNCDSRKQLTKEAIFSHRVAANRRAAVTLDAGR